MNSAYCLLMDRKRQYSNCCLYGLPLFLSGRLQQRKCYLQLQGVQETEGHLCMVRCTVLNYNLMTLANAYICVINSTGKKYIQHYRRFLFVAPPRDELIRCVPAQTGLTVLELLLSVTFSSAQHASVSSLPVFDTSIVVVVLL